MSLVIQKRVKIIAGCFIIIAIFLIILNFWELLNLRYNEIIKLYNKFDVDLTYYIESQTYYHISNFVLYIFLLLFSYLTFKIKKVGRIGLNFVLSLIIIYFFLAPIIFETILPSPQSISSYSNIEQTAEIIPFLISGIKAVVLIGVIFYLNKNEVSKIFNKAT